MERRAIDQPEHTPGAPVIKPNNIGSRFRGALVTSPEMRDQRDENGIKYKDDGTPRRELVLHLLCTEADCTAGSIDNPVEVVPGEVYRYILRGGAWGQWIEATKDQSVRIGDTVTIEWTYGQAYSGKEKSGGEIHDPAEVTRRKQGGQTVGIYGTIRWSDEYGEDIIRRAMEIDDEMKKAKLDEDRPAAAAAPGAQAPAPASTAW